jgi:hypothetical protein
MANYPSYEILLVSVFEEESGVDDAYAQTGTQHSRLLHSQPYYRFNLGHQLTLAEWNSLRTLYTAGRRDPYTLTYFTESPQQSFTVKFTGPPVIIENIGADQFFVNVPLRGYRN